MPSRFELGRRTDAREQQQLRRLDRPGADDDLVRGPRLARGHRPCAYSTPMQRPPSKSSRCALAEVSTVRFGSPSTGRRNASATLWRRPSLMFSWAKPTPSSSAPLWSSLNGMPASCAAVDRRGDDRMRLVAR